MHVIIVPLRQSYYMPGSAGIFIKLGLDYDLMWPGFLHLSKGYLHVCLSLELQFSHFTLVHPIYLKLRNSLLIV